MRNRNQMNKNSPIVALHSSASSSKQWKYLISDMDDWFDIFAFELPGYKASNIERDSTRAGMVALAEPLIDEIEKFKEPVHLIGHCFGGGVALKIALMRPDLVRSLTLYEPAAFHVLKNSNRNDRIAFDGLKRVEQALAAAARAGRADLGMKTFVDFWNHDTAWEQASPTAREYLSNIASLVVSDFSHIFAETWEIEALGQLMIPTLVLMGMDSPQVAQRTATLVADHLQNGELAILPGLGHMAPVTFPQWVNPRIQRHIGLIERSNQKINWPHSTAA